MCSDYSGKAINLNYKIYFESPKLIPEFDDIQVMDGIDQNPGNGKCIFRIFCIYLIAQSL